jgi:hypothetical protein
LVTWGWLEPQRIPISALNILKVGRRTLVVYKVRMLMLEGRNRVPDEEGRYVES